MGEGVLHNWICLSTLSVCLRNWIYTSLGGIGLGSTVVLNLSNSVINSGCKLYFDNYFTVAELLVTLHHYGISATGMVQSNQKNLPTNIRADKTMN